ncbi:MAG: hypothetical protein WC335_04630 [Candidatus Omnitrophota bacterium]|jgi:hypothetical protein
MKGNRGFVLLMVVSAVVMIIGGLLVSLFLLASTVKRTYYYHERLEAYYLCEVGVSKGLAVFKSGGKVPQTGNIDFALGDKNYRVKYDITGSNSKPTVKGYVTMVSGNTYFLKVGGEKLQWPFFLRGIMPPLMD